MSYLSAVTLTGIAPLSAHGRNTTLSTVQTISQAGARAILLQALGANLRYTLDGSDPSSTVGFQLQSGSSVFLPLIGCTLKVIGESAGAEIQYQFGS